MKIQNTSAVTARLLLRVVATIAVLLLLCTLEASLGRLSCFFIDTAQQTLVLLPSFALTAWQALNSEAHFSLCSLGTLLVPFLLRRAAGLD